MLSSSAKGCFRKAHGSVAAGVDLIAQLVPGIGGGGPEAIANDWVLVVHHIVVVDGLPIVVVHKPAIVVASKSVVVVSISKASVSVVAVKPIVVVEVVLAKGKATDGQQAEAHQENLRWKILIKLKFDATMMA